MATKTSYNNEVANHFIQAFSYLGIFSGKHITRKAKEKITTSMFNFKNVTTKEVPKETGKLPLHKTLGQIRIQVFCLQQCNTPQTPLNNSPGPLGIQDFPSNKVKHL